MKNEICKYPSLEAILIYLNNGKKDKMFLNKNKYDKDGYVIKWGTKKGEKIYSQLISLLCGIGELTNCRKEVAEIVENLDEIAESPDYI